MRLYISQNPYTAIAPFLFNSFVRLYVRPQVEGAANLPSDGPFIIASNHSSHADTAVLFAALPRALRRKVVVAAANDYFFKGGVRQLAARTLFNAIPVERDSFSRQDPLRHAVRALREGYGLVLYPEGTRRQDGTIGPFRGGIGRLVATFPEAPVVPTRLLTTNRVLPKGKFIPRPYTVHVRFGEPLRLEASLDSRSSWHAAANAVRDAVVKLGEAPIAD